jgi:hypothetical protein
MRRGALQTPPDPVFDDYLALGHDLLGHEFGHDQVFEEFFRTGEDAFPELTHDVAQIEHAEAGNSGSSPLATCRSGRARQPRQAPTAEAPGVQPPIDRPGLCLACTMVPAHGASVPSSRSWQPLRPHEPHLHTPGVTMSTDDSYPDVYQTLMMTGLLGHMHGCEESEVAQIDDAVEATVAQPVMYRVNCALAMGLGGNADKAKAELQKRVDDHPDDELAKITLGAALALAGDAQWRESIDYVVATSNDVATREIALTMIEVAGSVNMA